MKKIVLKGFIIVPAADLAAVLDELPNHVSNTISEKGCLVFDVSQDAVDQHKLHVYEEFESKLAFEQHQARVASAKWGAVAQHCERHYEVTGL